MWVSCNFLFVQFSLTSISVPPRCYYFMPHNCKDECPQLFTTILPQKWDFYCFFLNWKSILMILPTAGNIEWCSMIQMKKTVWFLDRQYEGTCLVWSGFPFVGAYFLLSLSPATGSEIQRIHQIGSPALGEQQIHSSATSNLPLLRTGLWNS